MVREPDATMQPTLQDNQLISKHRVLGFKPQLRLEWRMAREEIFGPVLVAIPWETEDEVIRMANDTKQPDHSASLGDFFTSSTRIRFSVRTTALPND